MKEKEKNNISLLLLYLFEGQEEREAAITIGVRSRPLREVYDSFSEKK